jgi:cutinase
LDNTSYKGTCDGCITAAVKAFKDVSSKCPNAKIAFLGYRFVVSLQTLCFFNKTYADWYQNSQGAAIMHAAVPQLPSKVQSQIVAGVLFGDTQNKQSRASINGFPKDKLRSFCANDDGVCNGGLNVNAGHVSYGESGDVKRAVEYLVQKFKS